MTQARKNLSLWAVILPDIVLLYLSLWLAIVWRYRGAISPAEIHAHFVAFSVIFALWLLVFFIHGLFEITSFRRYSGLVVNLASAMIVNFFIAVLYFYLQPNLILTPRRFLFVQIVIASLLILIWHLSVKYFIKNRITEDVYLFSFNNELAELEKAILDHNYLGFRVLGHLNEQSLFSANPSKNSSVILPDNLNARPQVSERLYQWRTLGARFYNYKDFYEQLLRRVYLSQLSEVWFLENINYQEKRFYNLVKRFIDLILGFVGLIFFIVSLPFCALLIKLSSPGPIFFVQQRVGKKGRLFNVYKYRSMSGGPINTWTSVNDPRITRVGKFLRKSKIDEWPQFLNLVLGHMSLVGPRPEQPHIVEELKRQIPFYDERHLVKPGITGWAQLNIYAGSLEESKLKLQYDLYYIKYRSLFFDLEIILKTIYYIFTWQGR
jgi:exopolysaccharide biosynthesis polyprenyl glycosylphosphotransferase